MLRVLLTALFPADWVVKNTTVLRHCVRSHRPAKLGARLREQFCVLVKSMFAWLPPQPHRTNTHTSAATANLLHELRCHMVAEVPAYLSFNLVAEGTLGRQVVWGLAR